MLLCWSLYLLSSFQGHCSGFNTSTSKHSETLKMQLLFLAIFPIFSQASHHIDYIHLYNRLCRNALKLVLSSVTVWSGEGAGDYLAKSMCSHILKCAAFKNRNSEIALESMPIEGKESLFQGWFWSIKPSPVDEETVLYAGCSICCKTHRDCHRRRRLPRHSVQFCSLKCTWFM